MLYTLPSIEMLLLTQYYVQGIFHHLALRLGISWGAILRTIGTMAFTFGMLLWSGFYNTADLFAGIGLGIAFGLFFYYWLVDFFYSRYAFFDGMPILKYLSGGMKFIASPHDIPVKKEGGSRRKHLAKWCVL